MGENYLLEFLDFYLYHSDPSPFSSERYYLKILEMALNPAIQRIQIGHDFTRQIN